MSRLDTSYETIAETLKEAGYRTAHFGKWHLGLPPYDPLNQGFDVNLPGGSDGGPKNYFSPYGYPQDSFPDGPVGEHIDQRLVKEAQRFIGEDSSKPFYVQLWLFSVHGPFQAQDERISFHKQRLVQENPQKCPTMAAMIESMDHAVGEILEYLKKTGRLENTLVIFTSDNGGCEYGEVDGVPVTSNRPLREGKTHIYEGGVRVPFIASLPGVIPKGTVNQTIVSSVDLYPTFLEAAGIPRPPELSLDGKSILPVLKSNQTDKEASFFCDFPHAFEKVGNLPGSSLRLGNHKLIRFYATEEGFQDRLELYDLASDVEEKHDLSSAYPDVVKKLSSLLHDHVREVGLVVPAPNPDFDPAAIPEKPLKKHRKAKENPEP